MPKPYSTKSVANYFLEKSKNTGKSISPMKLQKLIYFAYGWNLAIHDDRLINKKIEAWKYGPVISSLYHETKANGNKPIVNFLKESEMVTSGNNFFELRDTTPKIDSSDTETKEILDKVWEVYSNYSAIQLSHLTHKEGTPWDQTYKPDIPDNTDIDDESIKSYFTNLAES